MPRAGPRRASADRRAHPVPLRWLRSDKFQYRRRARNVAGCQANGRAIRRELPAGKRGLLFVGSPGVGKTHLAVSILKRLMGDKGIQCRFVDYRELLKQIQYTYNPTVQMTELELLQPVFETEVVLLDELGAIRTSQSVSY